MFAVPGWAVSADSLKAETTVKQSPGQDGSNNPKKRKRASVPANVTASNVADLWEQVIEGKSGKKSKSEQDAAPAAGQGGKKGLTLKEKKKLKKLKAQEEAGHSQPVQGTDKQTTESTDVGRTDQESKKKDKKEKNKKKKGSKEGAKGSGDEDELAGGQAQATPALAPAAPKLTPLQAAMREKLVSARFRHLNETLYTKPSADAFQLFEDSPEMFREYHEGFRRQVDVWPENPVDGYIEDIKQRGAQRTPHHRQKPGQGGDSNNSSSSSSSSILPLPRTGGSCTIADLGCGDAKLAAALQPDRKRLNLRVLSYDLQSPSPLVTRADVANLPLADGAVDVAIFCLALMGTNWLDFIDEAYRILHWKGELWVAEIKSRFGPVGGVGGGGAGGRKQHSAGPVAHSVGNRRKIPTTTTTTATTTSSTKKNKKKNGKDKDGEEVDDEADLAVAVDGAEDPRRQQETDVSAFVEALRKRGFLLQQQQHGDGDGAVDLRNKMFVKMRFVKAATPIVGKGVAAAAAAAAARGAKRGGGGGGGGGNDMGAPKNRKKFIEAADEEAQGGALDENSILKPCVYKIR
ncbi:methyltransferase-domain-containing protein [Biscogniauxia mediterranea]|nr:methyltransferase-domain-containing protein [Biscogniauxia mediterranea]